MKSSNVLLVGGEIRAVIDFGGLGLGDPACDLIVAWDLLSPAGRAALRAALPYDDDTWERARGWALSVALIALPYYMGTDAAMTAYARRLLGALGVRASEAERERPSDGACPR